MTLKLKLNEKQINLDVFLNLMNTTKPPKNVLNPAIKEIVRAYKVLLFIISLPYSNYMNFNLLLFIKFKKPLWLS